MSDNGQEIKSEALDSEDLAAPERPLSKQEILDRIRDSEFGDYLNQRGDDLDIVLDLLALHTHDVEQIQGLLKELDVFPVEWLVPPEGPRRALKAIQDALSTQRYLGRLREETIRKKIETVGLRAARNVERQLAEEAAERQLAEEAAKRPRIISIYTPGNPNAEVISGERTQPSSTSDADDPVFDLWPKMDPTAYYGLAGEIVHMADPHNEGDKVGTLIQLLVAFGNVIGRSAHFIITADYHYLNEYCALVGVTGQGRKGTTWGVVEYLLEQVDPHWKNHCIRTGLVTEAGLIYHVRDAIVGKDGGVTDIGVTDKRCLIIEEEFSRVLKSMNIPNSTLSNTLRNGWNGKPLQTMTRTSPLKATRHYISMIGHTTSQDLLKYLPLTEIKNGFANRILMLLVRRSKYLPHGGRLFEVDWTPIISRLRRAVEFARQVERMECDQEASEYWSAIYEDLSEEQPGSLGPLLNRAAPHVMRLACIYAVLDLSRLVRKKHIRAALAIWIYCTDSVELIFGTSARDLSAELLLDSLKESPIGLTKTDIRVRVFKNNKKKDGKFIAMILTRLYTAGLIYPKINTDTGGRNSEVWFYGRDPQGA